MEDEEREREKGRAYTRVCNICNGLFYSSDLSAGVELMAAEISHGNETIGIRNGRKEELRDVEGGHIGEEGDSVRRGLRGWKIVSLSRGKQVLRARILVLHLLPH